MTDVTVRTSTSHEIEIHVTSCYIQHHTASIEISQYITVMPIVHHCQVLGHEAERSGGASS